MAIFNSKLLVYQRLNNHQPLGPIKPLLLGGWPEVSWAKTQMLRDLLVDEDFMKNGDLSNVILRNGDPVATQKENLVYESTRIGFHRFYPHDQHKSPAIPIY